MAPKGSLADTCTLLGGSVTLSFPPPPDTSSVVSLDPLLFFDFFFRFESFRPELRLGDSVVTSCFGSWSGLIGGGGVGELNSNNSPPDFFASFLNSTLSVCVASGVSTGDTFFFAFAASFGMVPNTSSKATSLKMGVFLSEGLGAGFSCFELTWWSSMSSSSSRMLGSSLSSSLSVNTISFADFRGLGCFLTTGE